MGLAYLSFALGGGILGTLLMPWLHLWPGSTLQKQRRCQGLTGSGFRLFHWYLNVIGVMTYWPPQNTLKDRIAQSIEQSRAAGRPAAVMVVANHPTLVDTTAIMASYPYLIVIAKTVVFRFPLLRLLFRFCGHTSASADLGGEAVLADQLIARLKNGESVLLFPESTRSPDEGPRPFRRGPFEIANRAGVPIQPIAIRSGPGLLKGGLAWYAVPRIKSKYELTGLDPLFPYMPQANAVDSAETAEKTCPPEEEPSQAKKQSNLPKSSVNSASDQSTSQALSGRQLAQLVFDQISNAL